MKAFSLVLFLLASVASAEQPEGFVTSLWINVLIAGVLFIVWGVLWWFFPAAAHPRIVKYSPTVASKHPHSVAAVNGAFAFQDSTTFPWLLLRKSASFFDKVLKPATSSRAEVLTTAGLDAAVVVALVELGIYFFSVLFLYTFLIMLPINYLNVGGGASRINEKDSTGVFSIQRWSEANMDDGRCTPSFQLTFPPLHIYLLSVVQARRASGRMLSLCGFSRLICSCSLSGFSSGSRHCATIFLQPTK
jgi:hypothetical protein